MDKSQLLLATLERITGRLEEAQTYLTQLDGAIGDGDHGVSMTIGSRAVRRMLPGLAGAPVSRILDQVGSEFQEQAGATVGALLGAGLKAAATSLDGCETPGPAEVASAFRVATDRIMKLGKAAPGDKTLVDAIEPATRAMEAAAAQGFPTLQVLESGFDAARAGLDLTKTMIARKGRASRLGERSRGSADPGAASCTLILEAAVAFLREAGAGKVEPGVSHP